MNPTPEQVAAWAREAGEYAMQHIKSPVVDPDEVFNMHLVTIACAWRAEQDEKENLEWKKLFWQVGLALDCLPSTFIDGNAHVLRAAAIRANAPKVTT